MEKINILGINISKISQKQTLEEVKSFLISKKAHYIVTPNPEIILEAVKKDKELFNILNKADLALPDGIGLKFASWTMGKDIKRVTGSDLLKEILEQKIKIKIAILNWKKGLSNRKEIEKVFQKKYPHLNFLVLDVARDDLEVSRVILSPLNNFQPHILFCTFGCPWQEKWIYYNYKKIFGLKLAIGVGGSFDFLTGKIKRAPKIFRILGLEWLWRLLKQSWRIKRIWQAVVIFPYEFIKWRFKKMFK